LVVETKTQNKQKIDTILFSILALFGRSFLLPTTKNILLFFVVGGRIQGVFFTERLTSPG
jgi:Na+-transporting methylmalonyl-CoA/oxaloacetate decarboxylase beta subunit